MTNYCFFNTVKAWGGGEKWHLETAYYLQSKGNNVVLFLFPGSELEKRAKELNLNVVPIRLNNLSFYRLLIKFYLVDAVIYPLKTPSLTAFFTIR